MQEAQKLFVCGRLCLLGEHCDWAAGYRPQNALVPVGEAIVTGINHGLHASVALRGDDGGEFVYETCTQLPGVAQQERAVFRSDYNEETLLETAQKGGTFSYVAGVLYQLLKRVPDVRCVFFFLCVLFVLFFICLFMFLFMFFGILFFISVLIKVLLFICLCVWLYFFISVLLMFMVLFLLMFC